MKKGSQISLSSETKSVDDSLKNKEIVIVNQSSNSLSKEQARFNKITHRIQILESQIIEKEKSLETLLHYFQNELEPLIIYEAKDNIKAAFLIEEKINSCKLSKKLKERAEELIIYLLNIAFGHVKPDIKDEALYDRYSEKSYQEEKDEQRKQSISSMFAEMFGMDMDLEGVNLEDAAEIERLQREFQVKMREQEKLEKDQPEETKVQTEKQKERELREKSKQEAQLKSIKSLYLSLSKVLHPDKETDLVLKMEKEELMKNVTVAYKEKNFSALLKLESEWLVQTESRLNELSQDKLKIYIDILLERENELKSEKYMLERNPRFYKISDFVHMAERSAIGALNNHKNGLKQSRKLFNSNMAALKSLRNDKLISNFIDDFHSAMFSSDYYDDFSAY